MKNKALIILGILFLTFGGYAEKSSKISVRVNNYNAKITSEEAKNLALNHSKVSKTSAKITKLILGKENKKLVYEVEFTTLNKKYRYGIDANTGQILNYSQKDRDYVLSENTAASRSEIPVAPAPIAETGKRAKIQEKENSKDNFGANLGFSNREAAISNSVMNSKKVNNRNYTKVNLISEEEAREIILHNISGATDSDITRLVIKYENNRFIYSGKVNYEGNEYVIKLDGVTGSIIK
jgi:putative membrane protein